MSNIVTYAEFQYRQGEKSLEKCRRIMRKATESERALFEPLLDQFVKNYKPEDKMIRDWERDR